MVLFLKRHFPNNKATWKKYFKVFLPIILASTIIAINGMIDNFMMGRIPQGIYALGAVNSWTNIYMGLVLATAAAGSVGLAQFYHAKQYATVKEVARLRYMIDIGGAVLLFILVWAIPEKMISLFMSEPSSNAADYKAADGLTANEAMNRALADYNLALDNANKYIHIICVQWLLLAVSYDLGSQLREIGHARITLYTSIGMLIYHISLNAALIYGTSLGVVGPAIAGTTSQLIPITVLTFYVYRLKLQVSTKPWQLFDVSMFAFKLILRRYVYWGSIFSVTFFISLRSHFWDIGYPVDKLGAGVSGLAVQALAGAIMNIFITTFSAIPAMAANFVASELGKGNLEQARANSDHLKGFNTLVATGLSLLLLAFCFAVPYMTFLVSPSDSATGANLDVSVFLDQVSHSTMTICFYYPFWVWLESSYKNSQSGGKGKFMAITDWVMTGPVQIGWLSVIVYVLVPQSTYLQTHFWASYFICFLTDLISLAIIETYYYRYTWLNSLTKPKANEIKEEVIEHAHHLTEIDD